MWLFFIEIFKTYFQAKTGKVLGYLYIVIVGCSTHNIRQLLIEKKKYCVMLFSDKVKIIIEKQRRLKICTDLRTTSLNPKSYRLS